MYVLKKYSTALKILESNVKKNSAKRHLLEFEPGTSGLNTLHLNHSQHSATATFLDHYALFLVYKWIFNLNQANSRYC